MLMPQVYHEIIPGLWYFKGDAKSEKYNIFIYHKEGFGVLF